MPNEDKESSLKGLNTVHPANRLIYLKLVELRELYRNKSLQICLSLSKAIVSLKRYPLPINNSAELYAISGMGAKFCAHLQRLFRDRSPQVHRKELLSHNRHSLDRVCEFMKKNNFITTKDRLYRPPTYSNCWSFLCILGFLNDCNETESTRLTLEDVRVMFYEFSRIFPKAKLRDFHFLKVLAAKKLINFKIEGQEDIQVENFKYKYRKRYNYALTEDGKELIEILFSKLDIPMDNMKKTFQKLYQLSNRVNNSQYVSSDDFLEAVDSLRYTDPSNSTDRFTSPSVFFSDTTTGSPLFNNIMTPPAHLTLVNPSLDFDDITTPSSCMNDITTTPFGSQKDSTSDNPCAKEVSSFAYSHERRSGTPFLDSVTSSASFKYTVSPSPFMPDDNATSPIKDLTSLSVFAKIGKSKSSSVKDVPGASKVKSETPSAKAKVTVIDDDEPGVDSEIYFKSLRERLKIKYGVDVFAESDYEIITVVDKRELHDSSGKYFTKLTNFYKESNKSIIFRQLPLGDVIWVIKFKKESPRFNSIDDSCTLTTESTPEKGAKVKVKKEKVPKAKKKTPEEKEEEGWYVLDWVLERKTTIDLNCSIFDGRYEEQKVRLLNLRGFSKVIYLFEDSPLETVTNKFAKMGPKALNYKAVQTAKINTKFVTGFNVINTSGISHSACMLLYLHLNIENYFKEKFRNLRIMGDFDLNSYVAANYYSFARFKEENKKRFRMTYFELFGRQLRCIPKMGEQLTWSILKLWPTPYRFYKAINTMTFEEINKALTGVNKRTKMSKQVYEMCRDLFISSSYASSHSEACSGTPDAPLLV